MTECSLTMLSPTPPLDDAEEPILAVSSHAYIDSVDAIRRALAEESDADSETEDGDTPGASTGPVRAIEAVAPSRASVLAWFAYGLGDTLWMATAAAVLFVLDNSEYPSSSSSSSSAPPSAAWDVLWAVIAVVVTQAAAALGDRRGVHRALVCALGILGALALLAAGLALASHPRAAHLLLGAGQAAVLAARTLYDAQIPFVLAPAFRTLWQGICAVLGLAGALPPALWLLWRALAPASAPAPVALAISAALVHCSSSRSTRATDTAAVAVVSAAAAAATAATMRSVMAHPQHPRTRHRDAHASWPTRVVPTPPATAMTGTADAGGERAQGAAARRGVCWGACSGTATGCVC